MAGSGSRLHPLSEMMGEGITPDVVTYNSTVRACRDGRRWEQVSSVLSEMRGEGVTPDVDIYNSVVKACMHGWQRQKSGHFGARCGGNTSNVVIYSSVIGPCGDKI